MGLRPFSPLVLIAAHTERIRLGTGVVQISARTPAATAMQAVTLDHISNGRTILGLGVSGPQVVEGWYGMPSRKPLARTREYVEILRQAFRREGPLEFQGDHYQLPYTGEGAEGLGKPLKIMTHPLREIPIWIGAEGPKRHPDLPDRRRLDPALLLAVAGRGVPRAHRGSAARLRDRRQCVVPGR